MIAPNPAAPQIAVDAATRDMQAIPDVCVASRVQDVLNAWRLVYKVYRTTGLIHPNEYELHTATRSVSTGTAVFYAQDDHTDAQQVSDLVNADVPLTTLTAVLDNSAGLPLDSVYSDELNRLRDQGRVLIECGQFAHRRQLADAGQRNEARLLLKVESSLRELMRHAFHYGEVHGANDFLIGVHPRHARFYCRAFGFAPMGEQRHYALVNDHPVQLMRADLDLIFDINPRPWALAYSVNNPLQPSMFDHRWIFNEHATDPHSIRLLSYMRHRMISAELAA